MTSDFRCTFWISYSDWTTLPVSTLWPKVSITYQNIYFQFSHGKILHVTSAPGPRMQPVPLLLKEVHWNKCENGKLDMHSFQIKKLTLQLAPSAIMCPICIRMSKQTWQLLPKRPFACKITVHKNIIQRQTAISIHHFYFWLLNLYVQNVKQYLDKYTCNLTVLLKKKKFTTCKDIENKSKCNRGIFNKKNLFFGSIKQVLTKNNFFYTFTENNLHCNSCC